jgi:peptidyl-prolyl cis-trans isomerase D
MLSLLRKHAASTIIKIILGLIVIVFIFWGFGWQSQKPGRVAIVNGETISIDELRQAHNNLLNQYRQQYGDKLNEEFIKQLDLEKQALDQLINKKVLLSEAQKLHFRVSDQELANTIRKISAFQRNGQFDHRVYQDMLRYNHLTPEEFEEYQRQTILINKLRNFVTSNTQVSDDEARKFYNWLNASVKIKYVMFNPSDVKDIEIDEDAVKTYFEKNKDNYKTKPEIKVRYLYFNPENYQDQVNISPEQIKEYYETNIDEFSQEKTVAVRHILIKVDQNASDEIIEEKKQKILEILDKARKGKDFAELAKKFSECPSKNRGGLLDDFRKQDMVKPFADQAFSMNPGDISDPVRTQFGWHIIKLEKINEASILSLDEVSEQIKNKMIDKRKKELALAAAEAVYSVSFGDDDIVKAAKDQGIELKTTGFFTKSGPDEIDKQIQKNFSQIAFDLSDQEISEIQKLGNSYYIIQQIDRKPGIIPEFASIENTVKEDWIQQQKDKKALEKAESFLKVLQTGETMETLSVRYETKPVVTDFFQRNQPIPGIGSEWAIASASFELSSKNKYPDSPVKGKNGYYVFMLEDKKFPPPENFEKEMKDTFQQLTARKKTMIFQEWISEVRSRSQIEIKKDFFAG